MDAKKEYVKWMENPFLDKGEINFLKGIECDRKTISELFSRNLTFGTAGMRGVMGIGSNKINAYQIAKATQSYVLALKYGKKLNGSTVIGFDTRHKSGEFAEIAARVLIGNGMKVYMFQEPRPVPEISYAIRELEADGGILITASHNPKEYNGYKVYNSYGGQRTPDEMQAISTTFQEMESFDDIIMYEGDLSKSKDFILLASDIDIRFQDIELSLAIDNDIDFETKIVYSPLHGTGIFCIPEILNKRGFTKVFVVEAQAKPDPDFPTVESPNPEDHKALEMALALGNEKAADIILATDPDCDRVGVGIRNHKGELITLSGNQIGALLVDYIICRKKELGKHPVMIQTVVTGAFGKKIAEAAGITVVEVLTGFKYIGELMTKYEKEKTFDFIFGYEESYGCLSGTHARDKDGANACMLLSEMCAYYKKQSTSIYARLEELYAKFGIYFDDVHNIAFPGNDGMEKMEELMENIRNQRIEMLIGEELETKDFLNGNTGLPRENAIKYELPDGSFVALRPSGTEPKLKIYISAVANSLEAAIGKSTALKDDVLKRMSSK